MVLSCINSVLDSKHHGRPRPTTHKTFKTGPPHMSNGLVTPPRNS